MTTQSTTSIHMRSAQITFSILAGIGVALGSLSAALADTATPQPLQDFQNPDKASDPFSSRGGQSGMMDFIHRAMQGSTRSVEEFSAEQDENLDASLAEFRAQQAAEIRKRQQTTETNTTAPDAATSNNPAPTSTTP
ncbi:hypothetical protein [Pantanalinema sp. GBBB05]|uniref:hypothetical protein n=1 Tax=Pantanalinema sp. GBBB05 TaxID=2604139 RepID=UPI001D97DDE3|nr:hypothetical protein [Pantanalinema sp. GBBB05]